MTIQQLRNLLEQQKGKKLQIEQTIRTLKTEIRDQQQALTFHEKAREVIRDVGLKTQQSLQFHISDVVSSALDAVFEDPYVELSLFNAGTKLNVTSTFVRGDLEIDPIEISGVGKQ